MIRYHWNKIVCLVLLWPAVVFGLPQPQEPAIKLESSFILVDAIVLSKKTNSIVGDLTRDDFVLLENGKTQEITHFSQQELPLSVVLLVDVSGSVQPIIDEVQRAALEALGQLKPDDKVALMIFGSRPKLVAELTTDRDVIASKLDDIWSEVTPEIGFATFINAGIHEAARYLRKNTQPTERRAILMVTDDMDTSFFRGGPPRDVVARELYEGGTTLCGIIVGYNKKMMTAVTVGTAGAMTAINPIAGGMLIAMRLMQHLSPLRGSAKFYAEKTGGITVSTKHDEVGIVLIEMLKVLRTRYTLGYAPADLTPDGRFREIKLTVSNRVKKEKGDLTILARRGYYVRKPLTTEPQDDSLRLKKISL
ncbi:MAG: VWA domain-containing protein [Acidobacteriota bacterium]|nr:VWA domain-containing protein [Blastocatellia bacterium]MDW8240420.1 VWA domain-containing protein [Acidobacteriota bacterium]